VQSAETQITDFVRNSIFTLKDLNAFISNFNYGYAEQKDKPVFSDDDLNNPYENLGQTADQVWLLSHLFLFFAEPFSHHCPKVWEVLLQGRIHLPSQILKFGPLVRTWGMRFKAKHQQFQQIPKITKNFQNFTRL